LPAKQLRIISHIKLWNIPDYQNVFDEYNVRRRYAHCELDGLLFMQISSHLSGILCILVGLCSGVYLLRSLIRRRASRNWLTTTGTILESRLDEDSDGYVPRVAYEYAVDGERYTNDRLYFHTCNSDSERAAGKHLSGYPVGERVNVYYNCRHPSDSVLDRNMPIWLPLFWLFFTLFFILAGIAFLGSEDQTMKNTSDADFQNAATPNHALQRTAPRVTIAAVSNLCASTSCGIAF